MNRPFIQAKRCKFCNRIIAGYNKSGICSKAICRRKQETSKLQEAIKYIYKLIKKFSNKASLSSVGRRAR